MDSPGISIENPSNITYLLLVSFFLGGREIQSSRWILLFKKVSCFSNPSISWINSVVAYFKLSSNMLAYWNHSYIHLWTPRATLKLSTLECEACVSRPRILCTKGVYYLSYDMSHSLFLLRYIIWRNVHIANMQVYIHLKPFETFFRWYFSPRIVDPRVCIGLEEIFNNLQMPMTTSAMQGFFLEKWNPGFFWRRVHDGSATTGTWEVGFFWLNTRNPRCNMEPPKNDGFPTGISYSRVPCSGESYQTLWGYQVSPKY